MPTPAVDQGGRSSARLADRDLVDTYCALRSWPRRGGPDPPMGLPTQAQRHRAARDRNSRRGSRRQLRDGVRLAPEQLIVGPRRRDGPGDISMLSRRFVAGPSTSGARHVDAGSSFQGGAPIKNRCDTLRARSRAPRHTIFSTAPLARSSRNDLYVPSCSRLLVPQADRAISEWLVSASTSPHRRVAAGVALRPRIASREKRSSCPFSPTRSRICADVLAALVIPPGPTPRRSESHSLRRGALL